MTESVLPKTHAHYEYPGELTSKLLDQKFAMLIIAFSINATNLSEKIFTKDTVGI